MVRSKKPFNCPNFGAKLWRTKNIFVFNPPRFGVDHWRMESKKALISSNVFQIRLLFSRYYSFPIMELQCKIYKKLAKSQKSFFWIPMFNIELWRPRETFLVLCPFLPLNAQNFIFYAVDILYQFVLSQFFYNIFFLE